MKTGIHPDYVTATVKCSCGNEFETRATVPALHVEICSNCHPFYTGKQKLVDTGGRVERFQKRYEKQKAEIEARTAVAKKRTAAAHAPVSVPAPDAATGSPPEPAAPETDTATDAPAKGAPASADA